MDIFFNSWKEDFKLCARPRHAPHPNFRAMIVKHLFDERQSKACALSFRRHERLENPFTIFDGNSWPIILDAKPGASTLQTPHSPGNAGLNRFNRIFYFFVHSLYGVLHEIAERLLKQCLIA